MKSRIGIAFGLGVVTTVISLGTFQLVSAAGDSAIAACANKTTGAMRLLTKGVCKKTETKVTWNQQGPTGAAGTNGEPGTKGEAGVKGDTGASGQNLHVVDAAGQDHGLLLGLYSSGQAADILYGGGVWTLANSSTTSGPNVSGAMYSSGLYTDSSCVNPIWYSPAADLAIPTARGSFRNSAGTVFYVKPSGTPFLGSTMTGTPYRRSGPVVDNVRTCQATTFDDYLSEYFTAVTETTPPKFTAPFTIVQK